MSASERPFHQFSRFPAELQLAVWHECLPHRIHELDCPVPAVTYSSLQLDTPTPCMLYTTTYLNGRPPVISRVCRASRAIALETGGFPKMTYCPPEDWGSPSTSTDSWLDPVRDLVHLNWTHGYEPEYSITGTSDNLLNFLAWSAGCVLRGGSFMVDHLEDHSWIFPPSQRFDTFKRISDWMIVTRVIVIHADRRTGASTGLFGLLGDASVQIVDISDEARIATFFDLAEECERRGNVTVHQDLHRDSAESVKQKLRDTIIATFGSETLVQRMHPAIMFRLCTYMCNHPGERRDPVARNPRSRGRGRGRGR